MEPSFETDITKVDIRICARGLPPALGAVDPANYIDRFEIARGGMGRIVAARDRRLDRAVALKELCVDLPETRARLEREAFLTARLEHPSIVSVHEAGRWPTGEPFFAMKLVPGRSLDQVIAATTTLAERLALLPHVLAVADALAYAHQQRIIHRDLKPHNVLVGEFGETVVIDWGVAKDLSSVRAGAPPSVKELAPDPGATSAGSVLGTPAYMPPEQAAGEPVDERADVYAIGAMLYHLLTGHAPFAGMAAVAVVQIVQEEGPTPLRDLQLGLPADLVAIVTRAMARSADARYPTARGLADDLRRYQAGQLVGAHRYSWRQLAWRWLRRNRRAVTVAGASLLVLIAFGIISLSRIVGAEHRAQDERLLAEHHRADAEELMGFMLGDLRDRLRPLNQLGLLETVARKAGDYYAHRPDDLRADDVAKHALALQNLGDVLAWSGHVDDALARYRSAQQLAQALVALDPTSLVARRTLADSHVKVGDAMKAKGDTASAVAELRAAFAIIPDDDASMHGVAVIHNRLGDMLQAQGNAPAALREYRIELGIRLGLAARAPQEVMPQRDLALSHSRIGNVLRRLGDSAGVLAEYHSALQIAEQLAVRVPTDAIVQRDLGVFHEKVGIALRDQLQLDAALAAHRAALAIRVRLAGADPANTVLQRDLSVSHLKIADILDVQGKSLLALVDYRADLAITEQLAARDPGDVSAERDLVVSHSRLGDVLLHQHAVSAALDEYRTALALAERVGAIDPHNLTWQHDVAASHRHLGDAFAAANDHASALAEYRAALDLNTAQVAGDPSNFQLRWELAGSHEDVGAMLLSFGDRSLGLAELRTSLAMTHEVAAHDPANPTWQHELAATEQRFAAALASDPEALDHDRAALAILERLGDPSTARTMATLRAKLHRAQRRGGGTRREARSGASRARG